MASAAVNRLHNDPTVDLAVGDLAQVVALFYGDNLASDFAGGRTAHLFVEFDLGADCIANVGCRNQFDVRAVEPAFNLHRCNFDLFD